MEGSKGTRAYFEVDSLFCKSWAFIFLNTSMSSNVYQLAAISHPDFAGANLLMPDGEGRVAFHMAAAGGQVAAIKLLHNMTHGTLATLVSARDGDGHTPLHAAAERGHLKVVRQLLRWNAKLDDQSHRKSCPLHMAARHGHAPVLSFLLENSADIKSQDETGAQPLHLAVRSGSKRAVQILLQAGAQVDSKNSAGIQPLHVATGEGHDAIATLLLNARSDIRAAGISQQQKTLARSPEDVKLSGLKGEIHGEFWNDLRYLRLHCHMKDSSEPKQHQNTTIPGHVTKALLDASGHEGEWNLASPAWPFLGLDDDCWSRWTKASTWYYRDTTCMHLASECMSGFERFISARAVSKGLTDSVIHKTLTPKRA